MEKVSFNSNNNIDSSKVQQACDYVKVSTKKLLEKDSAIVGAVCSAFCALLALPLVHSLGYTSGYNIGNYDGLRHNIQKQEHSFYTFLIIPGLWSLSLYNMIRSCYAIGLDNSDVDLNESNPNVTMTNSTNVKYVETNSKSEEQEQQSKAIKTAE